MLRSITCSAALAALAIATPALASPATNTNTAKVHYSDLDLSTADGVKALRSRVRSAAEDVCDMDGAWKSRNLTKAQICMRVAMSEAQPQIGKAVAMYGKTIRRAEASAVTVES
ncbi:UrcA family protein [Qipengyuania sp.]|uniref:UrcA family protein n=1 Tax=Qipengyuania sp. TaxID=2004515 RepID=UPI0035C7BB6A